jgi:hypothetical protein
MYGEIRPPVLFSGAGIYLLSRSQT